MSLNQPKKAMSIISKIGPEHAGCLGHLCLNIEHTGHIQMAYRSLGSAAMSLEKAADRLRSNPRLLSCPGYVAEALIDTTWNVIRFLLKHGLFVLVTPDVRDASCARHGDRPAL